MKIWVGVGLAITTAVGALLLLIFMTRVDAAQAHADIRADTTKQVRPLEQHLQRLERKIDVIGWKVGAGQEMHQIDEETSK